MNSARPANPSEISFHPSCFVQDGTEPMWVASPNLVPVKGSPRFLTEAEALVYAKRTACVVSRVEVPVMRRVSWTRTTP